jgi:hypothetical protein
MKKTGKNNRTSLPNQPKKIWYQMYYILCSKLFLGEEHNLQYALELHVLEEGDLCSISKEMG